MDEARMRWNSLAKPLGSLGLLEDIIVQIAALTGSADVDLSRRTLLVLCADNGVTAQGVTQMDSSVTAAVARALGAGESTVCHMARVAGCRVLPVDVGILNFPGAPGVLDRRVRNGTADMTRGPAMSREECIQAIQAGMALVEEQKESGVSILATGEMGIGNTTTSSAVAAVLLNRPPVEAGTPLEKWGWSPTRPSIRRKSMFTLITGGSASGKSAFAEEHVLKLSGRKIYLAAMEPFGAEDRIEKHRRQRAGKGFTTVERFTNLAALSLPPDANILLECLGNLTANELYSAQGGGGDAVLAGAERLLSRCAHLTVVTNEVCSGGADYMGDTLAYMKELSHINRILAARADLAVEVVCGLPNVLKGALV